MGRKKLDEAKKIQQLKIHVETGTITLLGGAGAVIKISQDAIDKAAKRALEKAASQEKRATEKANREKRATEKQTLPGPKKTNSKRKRRNNDLWHPKTSPHAPGGTK